MKKVMVVEDEEFILQGILCINDWASMDMEVVHTAHNGKEALEKFREEPVDILLTDVEMPLMNGLELIGEIRKLSRRVRCLILSGYDEFEYARAALKMDVEEYILKPINEEQLDRALKQAAKHLDEMDKRNAVNLEAGLGWLQFLKGEGKEKEKLLRDASTDRRTKDPVSGYYETGFGFFGGSRRHQQYSGEIAEKVPSGKAGLSKCRCTVVFVLCGSGVDRRSGKSLF